MVKPRDLASFGEVYMVRFNGFARLVESETAAICPILCTLRPNAPNAIGVFKRRGNQSPATRILIYLPRGILGIVVLNVNSLSQFSVNVFLFLFLP